MVTVPWIEHIAQMTRAFIAKREKWKTSPGSEG
jgi:hypothetical protein